MSYYDLLLIEDYEVKVVLPEGSTDIKVHLPFDVDSTHEDVLFSTLDYFGRPVVVIKKQDVMQDLHNQYFQVSYNFEDKSMLIEPLYVSIIVFGMYVASMIFTRIGGS